MFGKFGRAQLQPFPNRQYSRALRGSHALNAELGEVIPWRVHVLRKASPRCTMTPGVRPVVIYTDAAEFGLLGVAIYVDGFSHVFGTQAPAWMGEAACDIYDLELAASLGCAAGGECVTQGGVCGPEGCLARIGSRPHRGVWFGCGRRNVYRVSCFVALRRQGSRPGITPVHLSRGFSKNDVCNVLDGGRDLLHHRVD